MTPVKTGILLINLGTPDATDYWSMRRYLKQFLSDKRVVEASGLVWWLVFNGIILTRRPKKSGKAYDLIWNQERDESPLKTITRSQADLLATRFSDSEIIVDWAMRYGNPSIKQKVDHLTEQGCTRILFFPLYPQYSAATTGTAMDSAFAALKTLRYQPAIGTVQPYFDHPAYIDALADSIRTHHASLDWKPEVTIASLHSLPVAFIEKGDPYQKHCEITVELLRTKLGMDAEQLLLTYQSSTGRGEWLGPETEDTLVRLANSGVKNLSVLAPGFASDCIETLEELNIRAVAAFTNAGGQNCTIIPCLNDSDASLSMIDSLCRSSL